MDFINWFGHSSFSFVDKDSGNRVYYIDPFELPEQIELEPADIVFITHAHSDHFSPSDLEMIMHDETVVVATPEILLQIDRQDKFKQGVTPNNSYEVNGFKFKTISAYNLPPKDAHPKEKNWVGYILEINGKKIYHSGDTDFVPEMKSLSAENLDIAMLPIGGNYTMDFKEAAEAANFIGAKTTIPMHYKKLLGIKAQETEEAFKKLVTNSEVLIMKEVS